MVKITRIMLGIARISEISGGRYIFIELSRNEGLLARMRKNGSVAKRRTGYFAKGKDRRKKKDTNERKSHKCDFFLELG